MRNRLNKLQTSVRSLGHQTKMLVLACIIIPLIVIALVILKTPLFSKNSESGDAVFVSEVNDDATPVVQVLVPGFSVKEIPLTLTNINVVRYGADGRLYALAYDGRIYVLTDTDNDGVEDKAEYWWDKSPLMSPVGMVITEEGIYVASKNKVSLIKDTDRDGKAETEEIITSDWIRPFLYTGTSATGIDAFGIAKDKAGNIFFALGAADFTRAYIVDSLGNARYDLESQRGTVLKVKPGSNEREIFCTGTRFPCSLAFNSEGDLFAVEQEGATWVPNGNPYDELLHIQEGRHYGFPPRHPKHLPNVIDEPSVYDYKPQHQSTTGLNFNLPVNNGPVFGPSWWEGDAIVSGYSRGKIYRTSLVKTSAGYVAQNSIFASLALLTVDAAVSPQGELVVATHSGFPDWGVGPNANGRLFKIFYSNADVPSPVAVWTSKPDQVRIAFDKPVNKDYLVNLAEEIKIEYGEYVEAGDRFEVLRPGYRAVERQLSFLRAPFQVKTAELSEDQRTLILNTITHTSPVNYAITLPGFDKGSKVENSIHQSPAIDLSYNLNGIAVTWQAKSGDESWEGVVPHLDLEVSHAFRKKVAENSAFEKALRKPGMVTWKTTLHLWNMLRPDTQPESTLDFVAPPENVNLTLTSSAPLEIKGDLSGAAKSVKKGDAYKTVVSFKAVEKRAYSIEVSMATTSKAPVLEVRYSTNEDSRLRALQAHRFFVPWLETIYNNEVNHAKEIPELAGGNWSRGKKLFFGESICANCHGFGGKGKSIGPDLSNLIFRDYKSVFRDISEPSASINPDYMGHTVTLKNGKQLTGMVSYKKDSMVIRDIADNKTAVSLKDVKGTVALNTSLMPPGLDKILGEQKIKDLLTYLLTSIKPADLRFPFLPPMRRMSEVTPVLRESKDTVSDPSEADHSLNILWVSSPKDPKIDPNNVWQQDKYDYPFQQQRWTQLLSLADNTQISNTSRWPSARQFEDAEVIVFYGDYPEFNEENGTQLDAFLARGGGLVYLSQAVKATADPQALANRIGLAWKGGVSKNREARLQLDFGGTEHPITEGFDQVAFQDEIYWEMVKGKKDINVLATVIEEGSPRPIIWTTTQGKGRVFATTLGYWTWTFDDPLFRILLLRGISWAGNQPVNKMEEVTLMGARVSR